MRSSTLHDPDLDDEREEPALDLAREMRRRWRAGERVSAEQLLADRPELCHLPEAAVELIYEEYCLRHSAGDDGAEQDLLRRFPQWARPLRLMIECHGRLLDLDRDRPQFPAVGERVADFFLVAELAKGSRGRVFLATETSLSDRPVVLKIIPLDGGEEHLSLARLQHTNIVPVYSVADYSARGVRVLCMPYFGHATLASLHAAVAGISLIELSGRHVVAAIDAGRSPRSGPTETPDTAARQILGQASYAQAICWIMACLADALHFAHERGVVHLDLKPSNVLLANDGLPMLLDFHLAREPVRPGGPLPEHFGGTPPYMPPEQQAALELLREGEPPKTPVDRRADVYALGAMLYESLGGRLPMTQASQPLDQLNPQVSTGLSDIVSKCVASNPDDRYANAATLAEDLRRYLTDQPLAGVLNRSITERWLKWRRRRPEALRALGMFILLVVAGGMLLAMWNRSLGEKRQAAELALADSQRQLVAGQYAEAIEASERGLSIASRLPFQGHLRQTLTEELSKARRLQLAGQLHELADDVRSLYGADDLQPSQIRPLAGKCDEIWQRRQLLTDAPAVAEIPGLAADLKDVALIAADLYGRLSENAHAAKLLDESEAEFGPGPVIELERRVHGLRRDAVGGASTAVSTPSSVHQMLRGSNADAWEHTALGRAALASGDLRLASRELNAAVELDPAGRWPNYYAGVCAFKAGHPEEAVAAFSVFIGNDATNAGCFFNRALAYTALGRAELALRDYDQALRLDPSNAAAALNRGMLHYRAGRFDLARADLRRALDHGADAATVNYDLGLVDLASKKTAGAPTPQDPIRRSQ